jgi:hypothetical protein
MATADPNLQKGIKQREGPEIGRQESIPSLMTLPWANADAMRRTRLGPLGGKSYVFFNPADFLETRELIDLRTHF